MFKNLIFTFSIFFLVCIVPAVYAIEPSNTTNNKKSKIKKNVPNVNWVHPSLRESYQGYAKFKEQKQYSPMWKYSTNRQSGNIKGGGTIKYNDYTPFYHPSMLKKKKD
ncbi:MAG: hypothetical protein GY707_09445 [Desulfobacteraceae bacterium]|nr:hypothetical protein [Desulfobacteraceae bacterium]